MSQRMDEKALFEGASKAADAADPNGDDMTARGFARAQFWREESMRARSEEARLLEENRAKDATIKALADALEAANVAMHRGEFGDKGRDRDVPMQVNAALRLVGRM